ncbi:MAG: T9SS type A sorting domain-containing protein [Bacteroidota bacterium]
MKKILLLLLFIGFSITGFSQVLELYYEGELLPAGSTITVAGDPTEFELVSHVSVKNVSAQVADVYCRKMEIEVVSGTNNYYCWNLCYGSDVYLSLLSIDLDPGQTTDEFSGHYQPVNQAGITQMCYSFFDSNNANDSTYFYVNYFASGVGIDEYDAEKMSVSEPYPNPAVSQTSFDYSFATPGNSRIVLMNMLGAVIREEVISNTSGTLQMNISDLREGVYFYSVMHNNEVIETKKLVVSR